MHMDQSKNMFDRSLEYTGVKTIEEGMQEKLLEVIVLISYQNHHMLKRLWKNFKNR